jgi:hypothetical protein
LCASKDFYIVRTKNPLIATWYNSNLMRLFLKVFSRRISEKWTRFLEEDYLAIPIPTETTEKQTSGTRQNHRKLPMQRREM